MEGAAKKLQASADSITAAEMRALVRDTYAYAATADVPRTLASRCCSTGEPESAACGSGGGLGCGDPTMLAALRAGEWVLDLGSGAGFDCFVAAVSVGRTGRVVGIDFTPEMVSLALRNASEAGVPNVALLLGEIERLPIRDGIFDVVMSNCVINLCADKARVLAEAWRVLKPGGRLAVSDIVALKPIPAEALGDLALHAGCISGAVSVDELQVALRRSGFESIQIDVRKESRELIAGWAPGRGIEHFVSAADITAIKH